MDLADIPPFLKVLGLTSLISLALVGAATVASAQAFQPPQLTLTQSLALAESRCGYKQLTFQRPKQRLPGRREPDLYRCAGFTPPIPLTALMPESNLGVTTVAHPTFFWYLPPTSIQQAEFVLLDANERPLYRTKISIKGRSGILSLKLPVQAAALKVDQPYRWQFELLTDTEEDQRSGNPSVAGWIIRIKPDTQLLNRLQVATLRDRPAIYAQQGIWHETLTSLEALACAMPQDQTINGDWQELMRSVQLPKIAQATSVTCQSKNL